MDRLHLTGNGVLVSDRAAEAFPVRVPEEFFRRIRPGEISDPLLQQVLPIRAEDIKEEGFTPDPLSESIYQPVPGLLHKYRHRALLIVTGACAIHCRYCFRRHFPYNEANPSSGEWHRALAYLRDDKNITEVILSGGDPLTLTDRRLARLAELLAEIPHLKRLRIHSRMPVVLPERVTDDLLEWIASTRLQTVIVIHSNHANELGDMALEAIARLHAAHIPLFNQSVLLRGINNSANTLTELSELLFEAGVIPYYLHMLDKVEGAAHFYVPLSEARMIMQELRVILPGYLVPRLVREIPGELAKVPAELLMI